MSHKGIHSRGYLPHWDFAKSLQGITFRLHDSVPAKVVAAWRGELKVELENPDPTKSNHAKNESHRRITRYEDAGHGCCLLRNPDHARIIQSLLIGNHGKDHELIEWCIMPNHVHVLVKLLGEVSLGNIVKRWKAVSAVGINRGDGMKGQVWMRDYHDRLIRDEEHFHNARIYIRNNPVMAGLCGESEEWEWSGAGQAWGVKPVVGTQVELAK